jgi:polar amino acid transport system permease protein
MPKLRRRTRRRLFRGSLYAVFIALAILIAFGADWDNLQQQFFQIDIARDQFPEIVTVAAKNTLLFTLLGMIGGFMLGLVLALLRLSPVAPYRWLATTYIEIFRGLPALLTIFGTVLVLPIAFDFRIPAFAGYSRFASAALVGLVLVAAAYVAEVIRAGIQAVPKGQVEAARSLGMSPMRTMLTIVLPQAIRIVIPPMTNEFVLLIKDTALIFIAVGGVANDKELTAFARDQVQSTGNATPMLMAAMMYLLITIPLTRIVAWMERRSARAR